MQRDAVGRSGVFVEPFPTTGAKFQLERDGDPHSPVWLRNGKELYYARGPQANGVVPVRFEPGLVFGIPTHPFGLANNNAPGTHRIFDIMPDGNHMLTMVASEEEQSIDKPQVVVVLNWFEELRNKMSAAR